MLTGSHVVPILTTDKFNLFVIEFNHTNIATEEDKNLIENLTNEVAALRRLLKEHGIEE